MTRPEKKSIVSQLLSETTATPDNAASCTATSQDEEVTNLKRNMELLKAEKKSALQRAGNRYREMMHANRRAERAEQALKHEKAEREGERMRATTLVISYKSTIENLKQSMLQRHEGPNDAVVQSLQITVAALEAAFAQQKEATVQAEMSAQKTIRDSFEAHKAQANKEAEQLCEQRLANVTKQMTGHFEHKMEVKLSRMQEKLQSVNQENDNLRKQLQQAHKTAEWHKTQAQQLYVQRGGMQSSRMAAGIHAGFSLQSERSPSQVKTTPGKRKRRESNRQAPSFGVTNDSTNVCSTPKNSTLEQQRDHRNPASNGPVTPPNPKEGSSKQQFLSPTRQSRQPEQRQTSSVYARPLQPFHLPQAQVQPSSMHIPQAEHQNAFFPFLQHMNAGKLNVGLPQLSPEEVMPYFNDHMAQMSNQQPAIQAPDFESLHFMQQQQAAGHQSFNQGHIQADSQNEYLPASTLIEQQLFASLSTPNLPPKQQNGEQQMHPSCNQQQQQQHVHDVTFYGGRLQPQQNLAPFLTSSFNADMSTHHSNGSSQALAALLGVNGGNGDTTTSYLLSPQLGTSGFFPETSRDHLDGNQFNNHNQVADWGPLIASSGGEAPDIGIAQPLLGDFDFSDFLNDPSINSFSGTGDISEAPMGLVAPNGETFNVRKDQEAHCADPQQNVQQPGIDNLELVSSSVGVPSSPVIPSNSGTIRQRPVPVPQLAQLPRSQATEHLQNPPECSPSV
ncbi:hypothetical protein SVAN01_06838 [Stagonosporopsis vannaccii]|nr:hypothetical protein SVAN01_06838 [Stagonosporopsis vannaccii]